METGTGSTGITNDVGMRKVGVGYEPFIHLESYMTSDHCTQLLTNQPGIN
jgi:hypothetical protein